MTGTADDGDASPHSFQFRQHDFCQGRYIPECGIERCSNRRVRCFLGDSGQARANRLNSSVFKHPVLNIPFSTSRSQHPGFRMISRRDALRSTLSFAGATFALPSSQGPRFYQPEFASSHWSRRGRSRWYIRATGIDADYGSAPQMRQFGDYVAICDADSRRRESAGKS